MKYFAVILVLFICFSAFPRRINKEKQPIVSKVAPLDSLVVGIDKRLVYFSCKLDSIVIFTDKEDGEYHTFSDCPCIDISISSHFLADLELNCIRKKICPLCLSKTKYFDYICDELIERKKSKP